MKEFIYDKLKSFLKDNPEGVYLKSELCKEIGSKFNSIEIALNKLVKEKIVFKYLGSNHSPKISYSANPNLDNVEYKKTPNYNLNL